MAVFNWCARLENKACSGGASFDDRRRFVILQTGGSRAPQELQTE